MAAAAAPSRQQFTVTAPGRVNIIGEHVDYMGGLVLPCAIGFKTTVECAVINAPSATGDAKAEAAAAGAWGIATDSDSGEASVTLPCDFEALRKATSPEVARHAPGWRKYVLGAIGMTLAGLRELVADAGFAQAFDDISQLGGVSSASIATSFKGTIPIGAGLSSSASLCVAFVVTTAELVARAAGDGESAVAKLIRSTVATNHAWVARTAQKVEHECAGVKCGIMDQFVSAAGGSILLDCNMLTFDRLPLSAGLRALGVQLVVANSMVKHELADGAYNKLRAGLEGLEQALGPALVDSIAGEATPTRLAPFFAKATRDVIAEEFSDPADFDKAARMGALGILPTALWVRFANGDVASKAITAIRDAVNDDGLADLAIARARYVATEAARTELCALVIKRAAALQGKDDDESKDTLTGCKAVLGTCLSETHAGLSKALGVSTAELDTLQELIAASAHGVGARMMGGGFGGCVVALVQASSPDTAEELVRAAVTDEFKSRHGVAPHVWAVRVDDDGAQATPAAAS